MHLETEQTPRALLSLFYRDKGPDDKGKAKKKPKKITKVKPKESQDDGGGWTEVKGSSLSASVCVCTLHITYLFIYLFICLFIYLFIYLFTFHHIIAAQFLYEDQILDIMLFLCNLPLQVL